MSVDPKVQALRDRIAGKAATVISPFVVNRNKTMEVTAAEVRAAAESNPDHPQAEVKLRSVLGLPDDHKVYVDEVDMQALIDNRKVELAETVEDGERIVTKVIAE